MCEDSVDDGMVAGEWLIRTECQGDNIVGGVLCWILAGHGEKRRYFCQLGGCECGHF